MASRGVTVPHIGRRKLKLTENMTEQEALDYEVLQGSIVDGKLQALEVRVTTDGSNTVISFDEEVSEDEILDHISASAVNALVQEREDPDFDYREPKRFRAGSKSSQIMAEAFYIDPFTSSQLREASGIENASSYPSQYKDNGLMKSIGTVSGETVWTLTAEGTKEALCIIGHPSSKAGLKNIRDPDHEASGLDRLFDDDAHEEAEELLEESDDKEKAPESTK